MMILVGPLLGREEIVGGPVEIAAVARRQICGAVFRRTDPGFTKENVRLYTIGSVEPSAQASDVLNRIRSLPNVHAVGLASCGFLAELRSVHVVTHRVDAGYLNQLL